MSDDTKNIGNFGENSACTFLKHHGYRIIDRNYSNRNGEIDVIARKGSYVVFVEVKTRKSDDYGNPYLFILNRDFNRTLDTVISLKGNFHQYEISKKNGQQQCITTSDKIHISLDSGDAVLIRLQPAKEEPFTITYTLES